jgi:hypothetical protein
VDDFARERFRDADVVVVHYDEFFLALVARFDGCEESASLGEQACR